MNVHDRLGSLDESLVDHRTVYDNRGGLNDRLMNFHDRRLDLMSNNGRHRNMLVVVVVVIMMAVAELSRES